MVLADQFISYVQKWSLGRTVNLNDYSDKFHYLLMTIFLILFATLTTVKQYVFQPIICEVASKPSGVNFGEYFSSNDTFWRQQPKAFYYQWVPFTLAVQAALFYLPRLLWLAYVHNREGPDLEALLESAAEANKAVNWKLRQGLIDGVARNIDYMLVIREGAVDSRYASRRRPWRRYLAARPRGCLPTAYALVKLLFLVNVCGQLYLMGRQLAPDHPAPFLFGFHLIGSLRNGSDWQSTRLFPRVTICRLKLLHLGGANTFTGQCALPLNMLNEKIYCFLWVACAVGGCLTCLSLVQWAMRMVCGRGHWRHHLRQYLTQFRSRSSLPVLQERELVREFADHLHQEGVFLVHMLRLNVGEIVACDVTNALFGLWRERQRAEADAEAVEAVTQFHADAADGPLDLQCHNRQHYYP